MGLRSAAGPDGEDADLSSADSTAMSGDETTTTGVAGVTGGALETTMAERLRSARRRVFVGRGEETETLRAALVARDLPWSVLFVHGPGGVGKTALLNAFVDVAGEEDIPVLRLDLRAIEPSPPAFLAALAAALGLPDGGSALDALADGPRRLLLLDTYEAAAPLDEWLRERLLPSLPASVLVVVAGRAPPGPAWTADSGWRRLLRRLPLRNLDRVDASAYLDAEGVPAAIHDAVLDVTYGHPLALSLLVDVLRQRSAGAPAPDLARTPDVVRTLLAAFLERVPSARQREALQVCAFARFTTEDLLRAALRVDDAGEWFRWLRGLSFVEEGVHGVFPHDLARDLLEADLHWRDPEARVDLHRRVRAPIVARTARLHGDEQRRAVTDLVFLHRFNPLMRGFWDWRSLGEAYADTLRPGDEAAVLAMTERYEGSASAAIAEHWLDRQPEAFVVFRAGDEQPIGFAAFLALHRTSEADRGADPGARTMWEYVQRQAPPRPDDGVYAVRFLVDRDAYQAPSPSFNLITVVHTQQLLTRPRLAWDMIGVWADPDAVAPLMAYIDYHRSPEADYEVGGRRFAVFARDWRWMDAKSWLEMMAERRLGAADPEQLASQRPAPVALSETEFADAVRDALRDLHRPDALAANPLLRTRLVQERDGDGGGPDALIDLLEEAVAALRADPRDEKLHRALARTFLRPAPTREAAAEALGVPFSTYRRHLGRGVERVVEWLWRRELYGPPR